MIRRMLAIGFTIGMLVLAGCAGGAEPTTPAETAAPEGEPVASAGAITLPDGWTIDSIITEAEVGEITGKTMTYFPEASSAAQNGKPTAGYTNDGAPNTKLFMSVDVAGGEQGFEATKEYADEATVTEIEGLGDKAYAATFAGGNVGVVALNGDALIRVDWPPTSYGDDAAGMGAELVELLLSKMYQ